MAFSGSERLLIKKSDDKRKFGLQFAIATGVCLVLFILFNVWIALRNRKRYGPARQEFDAEFRNDGR